MHYKIEQRQASVLVFDKRDDVYCAICQVFKYGDRGFMYGIFGPKFYTLMAVQGRQIMRDLGVVRLEGAVLPGHERLLAMSLRRVATVESDGPCKMAGKDMTWMIVRPHGTIADLMIERDGNETMDFVKRETT